MLTGRVSSGVLVGALMVAGRVGSGVLVGAAGVCTQFVSAIKAANRVKINRLVIITASKSCRSVRMMHELCLFYG